MGWCKPQLHHNHGVYGAKQELAHKQKFELHADEPPILAGQDHGANPVEHLLHALASCVTTSMVAHAAVRGIEIQELESELEGDIDLRGFLGLASDVPKGYTEIRVKFMVKTDEQNLERLKSLAAFSPVYNSLINGVKVDIQVEPKQGIDWAARFVTRSRSPGRLERLLIPDILECTGYRSEQRQSVCATQIDRPPQSLRRLLTRKMRTRPRRQ